GPRLGPGRIRSLMDDGVAGFARAIDGRIVAQSADGGARSQEARDGDACNHKTHPFMVNCGAPPGQVGRPETQVLRGANRALACAHMTGQVVTRATSAPWPRHPGPRATFDAPDAAGEAKPIVLRGFIFLPGWNTGLL